MAYDTDIDYGNILQSQEQRMPSYSGLLPQSNQNPIAYQTILLAALGRLEDLLDTETVALRQNKLDDIKFFSQRKSRALLELSHALRHLSHQNFEGEIKDKISVLRIKLIENQSVLKIYLDAMRGISELLVASIFDFESDGTYPLSSTKSLQNNRMHSAWL